MKTVKAKIELSEVDLQSILANCLGVKPSDVRFDVHKLQLDGEYVTAVITKEIEIKIGIPENSVATREADHMESAYEHYCPNNQ